MKIAVSAYSYSGALRDGRLTLEQTPKKAKEMGFEGIEFITLPGKTLDERLALAQTLKKACEDAEIPVVAYAVGASLYAETEEECERGYEALCDEIRIAAALGAPLLRHDVVYGYKATEGGRSFDLMLPVIAANVKKATRFAKTLGIRTCSENHGYVAQDSDRMERLVAAVRDENYGLLIDIGNFACADEDSVRAVSRLAPLAIHVHAKDFRITPFGGERPASCFESRGCNYLTGVAVGDGNIPVAQCIAILKRAGYDGFMSIEYEGSEDCIAALEKGRAYLAHLI